MAVAAFKSSSRRGTQSSAHSNAPPNTTSSSGRSSTRAPNPTRRSRSVSAFSRGSFDISTITEFLNKRDNPLFFDETQSTKALLTETSTPANSARSAGPGRRETGRVLSIADSGRRARSASQCPVSRRNLNFYTSEVSQFFFVSWGDWTHELCFFLPFSLTFQLTLFFQWETIIKLVFLITIKKC